MNISAELIAIAILGVSLVSLGWKVTGDLRQEIHHMRNDVPNLAIALATWNSSWPDWKADGGSLYRGIGVKAKPASSR